MRAFAVGVLLVASAALAQAQVPTIPIRALAPTDYVFGATGNPIDALSSAQNAGDWRTVQKTALEMLGVWCTDAYKTAHSDMLCKAVSPINRNYFNFVWQIADKDGKPAVARVLVHEGLKAEHASDLPGLHEEIDAPSSRPKLLDVFLSKAGTTALRTAYVSTRNPNPLLAQLADVVQKSGFIGFLAANVGAADAGPSSIKVTIYRVSLPFGDAKIQVTDQILTVGLSGKVIEQLNTTVNDMKNRQLRNSTCGMKLADDYAREITSIVNAQATATTSAVCAFNPNTDTTTSNLAACLKTITDALAKIVTPAGQCDPVNGFDPVTFVDDSLKTFVSKLAPSVVTGQATLTNKPLTWGSFGLMAGYMPGHTSLSDARVSVQSGKIAANPMPRNPTFVILNLHPWPYDGALQAVSWQERFRGFVGTAITPEFGVTCGLGFGIVRGLAVNAGPVWFFSDTLKSTETIGQAPQSKDPFETKIGQGWFFGLGYNFK